MIHTENCDNKPNNSSVKAIAGPSAKNDGGIGVENDPKTDDYEEYAPKWFKDLEPQKRAELIIQFFLACVGLAAVFIYVSQLHEMHTGGIDTHALADAAQKQAFAAKSFATSAALINDGIENAVKNLGAEAANTKSLVDGSNDTAYRDLRPYVQAVRLEFTGDVFKGDAIKGTAYFLNTGRTPAISLKGCADIVMLPNGAPMTDDFKCPAPNTPAVNLPGENSTFDLGSNVPGFSISSPGKTINPMNVTVEDFKAVILSGGLRLYFYGNVQYSDLIHPKNIHRTSFCGRYRPETNTLDVCELHNHTD